MSVRGFLRQRFTPGWRDGIAVVFSLFFAGVVLGTGFLVRDRVTSIFSFIDVSICRLRGSMSPEIWFYVVRLALLCCAILIGPMNLVHAIWTFLRIQWLYLRVTWIQCRILYWDYQDYLMECEGEPPGSPTR